MKIIKKELKYNEGEISLTPESLDDLWHINYLIEPRDFVFSYTYRRIEGATDKLRPEKAEKRLIRLGIRVEKVEFHKFANRLRIHGTIEEGTDTGNYHTLNIEIGTNLSIIKRWRNDQIERINDAVSASRRPRVVIATIEEGEASIGFVRQYGIDETSHIKESLGKREGGARDLFFRELAAQLKRASEKVEAVIIAGPGFTKEDFLEYLKKSEPEIAEKSVLEDTTSIGISGFQEVLKRGAVDRITAESRISREAVLMDELLKEIATSGKAAYGLTDVKNAFNLGAIDTLLITDEKLRTGDDLYELLKQVEKARGKIVVFSTEFEPGKRLDGLGGIAAILRYKIAI